MSNDVADIQATLKNIGVTATPEQIQNKLNALVKFNVTGNEAKRNVVRSLAKGTGVDPLAVFKAGSTPVHIGEIKEEGKWVSLRVKVIQLWDSTSDKITQTGLIGDESRCDKVHYLGICKPAPDGIREIILIQSRFRTLC